jgi:hypothetical protein
LTANEFTVRKNISVLVLPGWPTIDISDGSLPLVAGHDVTMTCIADVGRPPGTLQWLRMQEDGRQVAVESSSVDDIIQSSVINDNGTTIVTSKLTVRMSELDDGSIYRCSVSGRDAGVTSVTRWAEYRLQVQCKLKLAWLQTVVQFNFHILLRRHDCVSATIIKLKHLPSNFLSNFECWDYDWKTASPAVIVQQNLMSSQFS